MKIEIEKKRLLRLASRAVAATSKSKDGHPLYRNVVVDGSEEGRVLLAGTDMEQSVIDAAEADTKQQGIVAVQGETLFSIAKSMPEGQVLIEAGDAGHATVRSGKIRYKLPTVNLQDFPRFPDPGETRFREYPVETLQTLITLTSYAMSKDSTRPHLAGALFEAEKGKLRMVATDGHRLAKADASVPDVEALPGSILIPHKGVSHLKRMLDEIRAEAPKGAEKSTVELAAAHATLFVRHGDWRLSIRLTDDHFPPYARVIPEKSQHSITLPRLALSDSLKRIGLMAKANSGAVRLELEEGVLRLSSENPDVGEVDEEIEIAHAGEKMMIGFNVAYLLDVLGAMSSDNVVLELGGELDPGVLRPEASSVGFIGVLMPMRIAQR